MKVKRSECWFPVEVLSSNFFLTRDFMEGLSRERAIAIRV